MSEIKAGDVVQLKSGSPPMTVEKTDQHEGEQPYAICTWFENRKYFSEKFSVASLKPYVEDSAGGFFM